MTTGPEATEPISSGPYLAIEFADLEVLGMQPDRPIATELMTFCTTALEVFALRPDEVTLIITADFVESVKSRLPEGHYRDGFALERGAGEVGGKTMWVDGDIHVLLHAWLFIDASVAAAAALSPEHAASITDSAGERDQQARRTVIHEAQHVAMMQAGEDDLDFSDAPWGRRNLLTLALQLIGEYRAELGVVPDLRSELDRTVPISSFTVLLEDLRRIACVEYQDHLDVGRLSYDVAQQCQHAWKALAYLAAARRVAEVPLGDPLPEAVTGSDEWTLMVGTHWAELETLLGEIPAGYRRVSQSDLANWISDLADLLTRWLRTLGFRWHDEADGRSVFEIESWDLLLE